MILSICHCVWLSKLFFKLQVWPKKFSVCAGRWLCVAEIEMAQRLKWIRGTSTTIGKLKILHVAHQLGRRAVKKLLCWKSMLLLLELLDERPACDETVQFIRNYKHCSAASYCCCRSSRVFHAVDSSYTSSYPQAHTCSLWNASCTSCASNTLLRRHGSVGDSNLCTLCQM